jgi:transcriptional regulator with XRE-family HTH domain
MTAPPPDTPPSALDRVMLGERIAARRRALGITSHELSKAIGRGGTMVQMYERGHRKLSDAMLSRIAVALDCSLEELVTAPFPSPPLQWRKKERKYPHEEGDRVKLTELAIELDLLKGRGIGTGTVTRTPRKADYHMVFVRWDDENGSSTYIAKHLVVRIDDLDTESSP